MKIVVICWLHNMYMDDLMHMTLISSGIGEYLRDAFFNHLCYADDLSLISSSSSGKPQLLKYVRLTSMPLIMNSCIMVPNLVCFKNNTIKIMQPSFI